MSQKIIKLGQEFAIKLPPEIRRQLNWDEGEEVNVVVDSQSQAIIITSATQSTGEIEEPFVSQVNQFIETYRSALEALAE